MNTIGIYVKKDPEASAKADSLESWLMEQGLAVVRQDSHHPGQADVGISEDVDTAPEDIDVVVVLGGDGTFLSAVRWIHNSPIPILGVKFGEVGFLAETTADNLLPAVQMVLENRFSIRERMQLSVKVMREKTTLSGGRVFNDVVINKGTLARLADIETWVDGNYLTTFRADGLIIASPTGSTAYSLAAGGPIIHPAVPGIIMTPICPFTLTNRPLIVPDKVCIELRLAKKSEDIMLTLDGQAGRRINGADTVRICKDAHPVRMISLPDHNYYDVLKEKLSWSGGRV